MVASQTSVLLLTLAFIFKIYRKSKLEKEYANLDCEYIIDIYFKSRCGYFCFVVFFLEWKKFSSQILGIIERKFSKLVLIEANVGR